MAFYGTVTYKKRMADIHVEYENGVKDFPKTARNVTFEPASGMVIDLTREEDRMMLFDKFAKEGHPVYLIGATNNTGDDFNETTKNAYVALKAGGKNVLLGQWTDPDGRRFRDVSFAASGINLKQALIYKSLHDQQEILEVTRHGVRPI